MRIPFTAKLCLISSACLLGLSLTTSQAAEIRAAEKNDYSRIVFDFDKAVDYVLAQAGSQVNLTLDSTEAFDSQEDINALSRVSGFQTSQSDDNISVTFQVGDNVSLRHFSTGSRIIVDVSGGIAPEQPIAQTEEPQQEEPVVEETAIPEEQAEPAPEEEQVAEAEIVEEPAEDIEIIEEIKPQEETTADTQISALKEPHVIDISATEPFGLAVFRDWERLWLVTDMQDFAIPPSLTGTEASSFPEFERVDFEGGTAFTLALADLLDNVSFRAEGGGRNWKVIVSPDTSRKNMANFLVQNNLQGISLRWDAGTPTKTQVFTDPLTGLTFQTVTLEQPGNLVSPTKSFPEFDVFESSVGLAIAPKVDDLSVLIQDKDVVISRDGKPLAISQDTGVQFLKNDSSEDLTEITSEETSPLNGLIYKLDEWKKGGKDRILENEKILLAEIARQKRESDKVQSYIDLAKLEIANGRGLEAIGFLELAETLDEKLNEMPEFQALRGAANNLAQHYDDAYNAYSHPAFEDNNEINAWRAWTLSGLQDWNQAGEILPHDMGFLTGYTYPVRHEMALNLSEVALREGRSDIAQTLLDLAAEDKSHFVPHDTAAYTYLTGELFRQQGDEALAITTWENLENSTDDFYRVKSQFALTRLLLKMQEITSAEAIDKLEGLRFAWRGDDLETQILYQLGQLYLNENQIVKGFAILRQAASQSPDKDLTKQVTQTMTTAFSDVFSGESFSQISPVDAISLYEEFSELAPTGAEGDLLARKLAERLAEVDLLDRAANLLKGQLDKRLEGQLALNTAVDLARIQLMDRDATAALQTIAKAEKIYAAAKKPKPQADKADTAGEELTPALPDNSETYEDLMLLKARAYSQQKKTDEALKVLAGLRKTVNVVRMQADVAWRAQRWDIAARSLGQLVQLQNVTNTRPLNDKDAALILNWAISLNLAENRDELAQVKADYGPLMKATPQAEEFDVVTRPHRNMFLADRDTINRIVSEVDIFGDFLEERAETVN